MTPKLWQTAAGKTQGRGIKHWRMHKFGVVALILVLVLQEVVACKWGNVECTNAPKRRIIAP